jgi:DNA-binding LacI/PurR family transcriptional regulator
VTCQNSSDLRFQEPRPAIADQRGTAAVSGVHWVLTGQAASLSMSPECFGNITEELSKSFQEDAVPAPPQTVSVPKLADVAQLARVSSATASRVLTGSARVRPQTRLKVEEAMASLGYVRNRAPRGSAQAKRAGSIALVVCEENVKVFADPFFARILWSISKALATADLQPVLLAMHSAKSCRTGSRYLRSGHVDGAIIVSLHGRLPLDLESLGIPVVLIGRPLQGSEEFSYVDADNAGGAQRAVRYLLGTGRSLVATIAGPPDMAPGTDRLAGYRAAMSSAGLDDRGLIIYGDFSPSSGEHAMYRLLDRRPNVEAVFAASDLMAAGVIRALRWRGRRVPQDVAVVGFDDELIAQHTDPTLTTMRQPIDAMGAQAAAELLACISMPTKDPCQVVLDTKLVLRDSA